MTGKNAGQEGFSLIELVIVLAIIGLLAGIAITTYFSTLDRTRLSGDVRSISQALQEARMRAIASGIPHGVAFIRGVAGTPSQFFIFVDCDASSFNYEYNDPDTIPGNNGTLPGWDECVTAMGSDPMPRGESITNLSEGISFEEIFGATNVGQDYIVFNHLGQGVRGGELSLASGRIMLRNQHVETSQYDVSGVEILGATGMTEIITMTTR